MISWLEKHMVVTVLLVIWLFALLTAITVKVFWYPVEIPAATVTAYGIVFGALALAVGLWQFRTRVIDSRRGIQHDKSVSMPQPPQGGQSFPRWRGHLGGSQQEWRHPGDWEERY